MEPRRLWLPLGVALGGAGAAFAVLAIVAARRAEAAAGEGVATSPGDAMLTLFPPDLSEAARQDAALDAARRGLMPPHLLAFKPVRLAANGHTGVVYVMPDHFGVGTAEDWIRVPLSGRRAQRLATAMGWLLPTRRIADAIWQEPGAVRLTMTGRAPREGETRNALRLWVAANAADARAVAGRDGALVAGHRKEYTVGKASLARPGNAVIYGGRDARGGLIQAVENNRSHDLDYVDYSQVPRFVAPRMEVDGGWRDVVDVAADPELAGLVSHNGAFAPYGYRA